MSRNSAPASVKNTQYCVSIQKTGSLMSFKEIISAYSENLIKPIIIICRELYWFTVHALIISVYMQFNIYIAFIVCNRRSKNLTLILYYLIGSPQASGPNFLRHAAF